METESSSATSTTGRAGRPRPFLLVLLGIVAAAFLVMKLTGSAGPNRQPSNASAPRPAQTAQAGGRGRGSGIDPSALDVHLESLAAERPSAGETERNPFRFRPAPPPPAPPPVSRPAPAPTNSAPPVPIGPPPPPAPPPITVKFIGVIDKEDGTKLAVFTDCSAGRRQAQAREGGTVDGRYRLVKIGMQSVIIEHLDGRGRTTLAQGGQECVK
jgi:hypothetical protein